MTNKYIHLRSVEDFIDHILNEYRISQKFVINELSIHIESDEKELEEEIELLRNKAKELLNA